MIIVLVVIQYDLDKTPQKYINNMNKRREKENNYELSAKKETYIK